MNIVGATSTLGFKPVMFRNQPVHAYYDNLMALMKRINPDGGFDHLFARPMIKGDPDYVHEVKWCVDCSGDIGAFNDLSTDQMALIGLSLVDSLEKLRAFHATSVSATHREREYAEFLENLTLQIDLSNVYVIDRRIPVLTHWGFVREDEIVANAYFSGWEKLIFDIKQKAHFDTVRPHIPGSTGPLPEEFRKNITSFGVLVIFVMALTLLFVYLRGCSTSTVLENNSRAAPASAAEIVYSSGISDPSGFGNDRAASSTTAVEKIAAPGVPSEALGTDRNFPVASFVKNYDFLLASETDRRSKPQKIEKAVNVNMVTSELLEKATITDNRSISEAFEDSIGSATASGSNFNQPRKLAVPQADKEPLRKTPEGASLTIRINRTCDQTIISNPSDSEMSWRLTNPDGTVIDGKHVHFLNARYSDHFVGETATLHFVPDPSRQFDVKVVGETPNGRRTTYIFKVSPPVQASVRPAVPAASVGTFTSRTIPGQNAPLIKDSPPQRKPGSIHTEDPVARHLEEVLKKLAKNSTDSRKLVTEH
ncbi:MAG: hypothetical protein HQM09_06055 [Candidatus Riflebacteria bacterium]|nr:hypothetical protein [Candidatus Riflebacteria bacterium]